MKRIITIFFALMMVMTSIALADDYSSMSNDDLLAIINSARTELLKRELSLTPDQIFIENDKVSMYMDKKDIEFTSSGTLKIPVILVNNSNFP